MADIPFFQFYPGDYLAKTQHLTTTEHGAYLLLIMAAWGRKDCGLPDDDQFLARTVGLSTRKWKVIRPVIMEFWEAANGYIYNARLLKDRKALQKRSQTLSESGAKGAAVKKAKSLKLNGTASSHPSISDKPPLSILEPEPYKKDIRQPDGVTETISNQDILEALDKYNLLAESLGLTVVKKFTTARKKKLRARLKEHGTDGWVNALDNVGSSAFLCGDPGPWRADFDFLMSPAKLLKVIEGGYNHTGGPPPTSPGPGWQEFKD